MKFIIDNILLVALVLMSGGALLVPALTPRGKRVSTQELVQLLNRGKTAVVDVRSAEEFAKGHLRDAKNIPLADLTSRIGELDKSKGKTIVVVCQAGVNAGKAVKQIATAGFDDVVSLDGGVQAWQAAGLPTAK